MKMCKIIENHRRRFLNFNSKRFWGAFIFLLIITLTQMSLVNAFTIDDIKSYDNNKLEYTLTNAWGLGEHIGTLKLNTPEIFNVGLGYQKVAEITIINGESDYENILKQMQFYDINNGMKEFEREFDYKYKVITEIEVPLSCDMNFTNDCGTRTKDKISWEPFTKNSLLKEEEITIGIFTTTYEGDYVEWIPTVYGNERLTKWAVWTASLNVDLIAYYTMDDTTGEIKDSLGIFNSTPTGVIYGVEGKINTAIGFEPNNFSTSSAIISTDSASISFAAWIQFNSSGSDKRVVSLNSGGTDRLLFGIDSSDKVQISFTDAGVNSASATSTNALNPNQWYHIVGIYNPVTLNATVYVNGVMDSDASLCVGCTGWSSTSIDLGRSATDGQYFSGLIDEVGIWNRSLSDADVLQLYNNGLGLSHNIYFLLNSPANNTLTANSTINFNCSLIFDSLTSGLNLTLLINGVNNYTIFNTSADQQFLELQQDVPLVAGNHNWSCSGVDNLTVTTNSNTHTFSNYYELVNESYVSSTTSGATNKFEINLKTNNLQITQAYLHYNNTKLIGSIISNENNYTLTRNQISPGVSTATNISFYWNITFGTTLNVLTDIKNQTVSPIAINESCGVGKYLIYNITLVDEITQQKINPIIYNSSIKIDLNLYTLDRTSKLSQFTKYFLNTNSVPICIDNNLTGGETYSLDLQIEYGATNYSIEKYNIEKAILSSSTLNQNIILYDLDLDNAQKFKLIVRDSAYTSIGNALVKIERKYLENGTFKVTEVPKTDGTGITSASLQVDDVVYNFHIYDGTTLLSSFTDVVAICQTPTLHDCEIDFNAYQAGMEIPDYETSDNLNFTIDYNSTSKIVTSQFVILDGNPAVTKLEVIRDDALGTAGCEDTLLSASGTLSCTVPGSFGNSSVRVNLYKDDYLVGWGNVKIDQKPSDIYGVILTIISIFVLMTLIGMAVSDNPIITGVFLLIGMILVMSMNLIANTGFLGATASFLFLAIAVILVLIKAARRS